MTTREDQAVIAELAFGDSGLTTHQSRRAIHHRRCPWGAQEGVLHRLHHGVRVQTNRHRQSPQRPLEGLRRVLLDLLGQPLLRYPQRVVLGLRRGLGGRGLRP